MMSIGSLFSGIGGLELGLERTGGFKTAWQCEIDPFCLKVLAKHWPDVKRFTDIKKMGLEEEIPYVDVICGGFPCQDISCAGKGAGIHAERSGLWWEAIRIIRLVRPRFVIVENVAALLNRGLDEVLGSLAESGYDAEWTCLRASDVGAPHRRERVFLVAHTIGTRTRMEEFDSSGQRRQYSELIESEMVRSEDGKVIAEGIVSGGADVANAMPKGLPLSEMRFREKERTCSRLGDRGIFRREPTGTWPIESGFCRMVDGIPRRVDRLRSLGNSVVPQVSEYVGRCILEAL